MLTKDHKLFAKRTPWDHQVKALNASLESPHGYAFFFEPGLGKTFTCISALRLDCARAKAMGRTLIIAPIIVLNNWRKEILEFSKFEPHQVKVMYGPKQKRLKTIEDMGDGILITNYKTLSTMPEVLEAIHKWLPDRMVLDESHRCKNMKSKQTKAAIKLSKITGKNYILTGTPILNSMEDIFAQFLILDGGEALGKSQHGFLNEHFTDKNKHIQQLKFSTWVPKRGAAENIHELISTKSMFVEKSEALDLPPLVRTLIEVELSGEAKKAYDSMLRDFVAFLGNLEEQDQPTAAVASLVLTRALRLQQISTGFVTTETAEGVKGVHRFKKNPKKEALKELLSDVALKSKVIVWAVFKENYKDIREVCDSLKLKYVEVHGEITKAGKDESVRAFNEDEDVQVLIGHPASGGIGINLVSSDVSVFYSRSFSLENDIQAEARNYRGGSERHAKVTRYDLVATKTIDTDVMEALRDKKEIGLEVLKGMI